MGQGDWQRELGDDMEGGVWSLTFPVLRSAYEAGHVDPPSLPQPHIFTSLKPRFLPELEEESLRGGLQASQNLKEVLEPLVCIKHPSQSLLPSCK